MDGLLVIDKPPGITSAAVVAQVKRKLSARRVGHTGTLDPMATGVLPICVGQGTKIAGYLLAEDKEYEGEFELGIETDTLDREGQEVARNVEGARLVRRSQCQDAVTQFVGAIAQVPPMYSALKHMGKRLHQLAREGQIVDRPPRAVVVHRFELEEFDPTTLRGRFSVACSKGTYVRSLIRDLGSLLGCGAHLTELRRIRAGAFDLTTAIRLADLDEGMARARRISPARALDHLPAVSVAPERVFDAANGKRLAWSQVAGTTAEPGGTCRLLLPDGELLALVHIVSGQIHYDRVFTT